MRAIEEKKNPHTNHRRREEKKEREREKEITHK